MHVTHAHEVPRRRAPIANGPAVSVLTPDEASDQVAVMRMELPGGARLPEHDHGASEIVLVPLSGAIELRHEGEEHPLSPGSTAHIGKGERVSLANPGTEAATLMVVAAPPEFVRGLDAWPVE
ncbi:cupin domain-containing protein [Streptomyces sp. TP-A0874]|uniref:cupin domain-containing protein n=1 Tax=Streptomyces sp. TP-A0874 TaxID=549819 RepID=UPI000853CE3D|nr:cupin domain-containing protein [Streptomyces sp. TP-A0874]